jgi:hypothetical protein
VRIPGLTYWQGGACGGALSGNGVSKTESTERNETKEEKKTTTGVTSEGQWVPR